MEGLGGADAYYVRPALVELQKHEGPALHETFAPILYVVRYSSIDEAIAMNNAVGAGLSSSIFTLNCARPSSSCLRRFGLRHRQRQHRPQRRRNWRRVWWREETGGGREAGSGQLEGLHAPRDQHHQLFDRFAAGAGREV